MSAETRRSIRAAQEAEPRGDRRWAVPSRHGGRKQRPWPSWDRRRESRPWKRWSSPAAGSVKVLRPCPLCHADWQAMRPGTPNRDKGRPSRDQRPVPLQTTRHRPSGPRNGPSSTTGSGWFATRPTDFADSLRPQRTTASGTTPQHKTKVRMPLATSQARIAGMPHARFGARSGLVRRNRRRMAALSTPPSDAAVR